MEAIKTIVNKVSVPSEKKTKQKEYLPKGTLPIIDQGQLLIGGYTNDTSKTIICNLPVIVFGDHTCCVKYIDFPFGAGADGIKVIKPKEGVLPKYLFYGIQYLVFNLSNRGYGRHYQHIEKMSISVPPISQQERIVSQIEESLSQLDSAVETLKKTKQQLEVYRQAVIENAISDGKTNSANSVPFGDLVLRYQNGISKRSGKGIETPVLRLADIDNQQIVAGKGFRYIGLTDIERSRFLLNAGDLLIIRVNGSENNVGRSIVVQEDKRYTACDHFIRCQVDRDRVLPEYAQLLLDSYPSRKHIKDNMVSTAGQNTVSQSTMSNIPVYVPSVELQKSILLQVNERLSNCEFIQNTIEESLSQAEALRQSILKRAFEGE